MTLISGIKKQKHEQPFHPGKLTWNPSRKFSSNNFPLQLGGFLVNHFYVRGVTNTTNNPRTIKNSKTNKPSLKSTYEQTYQPPSTSNLPTSPPA